MQCRAMRLAMEAMLERSQLVVDRMGHAYTAFVQVCRHPIRKALIPILLAVLARIDPTWD
jgi:hypothetical protein